MQNTGRAIRALRRALSANGGQRRAALQADLERAQEEIARLTARLEVADAQLAGTQSVLQTVSPQSG